jgi:PAS domain S-box-containing protein
VIKTGERPAIPSLRSAMPWLPFLVFLLLGSLVAILWRTLDGRERANLRDKARVQALDLASHFDADLRNRIPALRRMAERWEMRGGTPKNEFLSDAEAYISDLPGFQALEWVDADYVVRWVAPLAGNERALNFKLASEHKRLIALEKAKSLETPTATAPVDLVQGGRGFLMYFPIYVRGGFQGFILAVFRIQEWMDYVLELGITRPSQDFEAEVVFDDVPVYRTGGWDTPSQEPATASAETQVIDHHLIVSVRPTATFIAANRTNLPLLTAIGGGILSLLAGFIVRLILKAADEAWIINSARKELEAEVIAHRQDEDELKKALFRLDMATRAGGIGVWTWDLATDLLSWNEKMYDFFELPEAVQPSYETWREAVIPEDRTATEELLTKAVEGTAVFDTEFRIRLASGALRYLGAAARVERGPDGKPFSVTGINWDLTKRREAEEAFRKSDEQVRLLLDSTAEAIYGIDMEGRCTFANPACLRMLGYEDADRLLGKNMHSLVHHSYADGRSMPEESCRIYQAFRNGSGTHCDDEVLWKADGSWFPVEYWAFPQILERKVIGAVVTFVDIAERKRVEAALAAATKNLEAQVAERTRALSEAHERIMEQRRLESDLELAGQVQASLLPKAFPVVEGFEFSSRAKPSRFVNGDFFDYELRSGKYCSIMLADIAGKGLPAALLAASARSLYRHTLISSSSCEGESPCSPGAIIRELNASMLPDLELTERFITMIATRIDLERGLFEVANAGGCEVIVTDGLDGRSRVLSGGGLPIGIASDLGVEVEKLGLRPGMGVLIYSDGITEAINPSGELFGIERLLEVAAREARSGAEEFSTAVLRAVELFQDGLALSDDATLVVIKAKPRRFRFEFLLCPSSLDAEPARVASACFPYGEKVARDLELASSEILTNIHEHGYSSREGRVVLELRLETRGVELLVREWGASFDLGATPSPALGEAREGGFGLFIVRSVMDHFSYEPGGVDGNLWVLFRSTEG